MAIGTAVAIAASVATVAAAGMQAASAAGAFDPGGGGGGMGSYGPSLGERLFNRGTSEIYSLERQLMSDAAMQRNLIQPEMYRALGYEPVYDRPEDPRVFELSQEADALRADIGALRSGKADLQSVRGSRGKEGRRREIRGISRERRRLEKRLAVVDEELNRTAALPRRIIGFNQLEDIPDPTGSSGGSFARVLDEFGQHLEGALRGEEPIDPTLMRTFEEREGVLRERLRRQLGPDYETTTAGRGAIADFDREKSEAFAQFNRENIGFFAGLAENRASALSNLTTQRLRNLAFPSSLAMEQALAFGQAAQQRDTLAGRRQADRLGVGELQLKEQQLRQENQAREDAQRQGLIQQLAGGVGSAAPTLGQMAAPAVSRAGGAIGNALFGQAGPAEGGPGTQGFLGAGGTPSFTAGKISNLLGFGRD